MAVISTKRALINKANTVLVTAAAVATFVTIFSLIATKTLVSQAAYQNRVITAKKQARDQLKANVVSANQLDQSYVTFDQQDPNIIGGSRTGNGGSDGSNSKIILDALPSNYDFPALATSLDKMITSRGLAVVSLSGQDDEIAQQNNNSSSSPQPVPMPFALSVSGNYATIQQFVDDLQNSIRPIQVQTMNLTGADNSMTLTLSAQTYYQPGKSLNIGTEVVK